MSPRTRPSETDKYKQIVESYVAAGADERVQQVVTAVHRVSRGSTSGTTGSSPTSTCRRGSGPSWTSWPGPVARR